MNEIDLITFSELIDKLMTVNTKLFMIMDKIALPDLSEDELRKLNADQINLVKQRSFLKTAIDMKLNIAIKEGGTRVLNEVKKYS
jgi:hypothetical protein